MRSVEGAVMLVTGATDGIGLQAARGLAGEGATVLLHGRDEQKVETALGEVRDAATGEEPDRYVADLSSLEEARRLADEVRSDHGRLDVLVNNAGVMTGERVVTGDGIELTFAVNYLAPYLISRRLIPALKEAAVGRLSRIVNVSSSGQSPIDFSDPMLENGYGGMRAYSQSKLALAMLTFDLAEELEGEGVTANCLHPGTLLDTKMVQENFGSAMGDVQQGAEAIVYLATAPELEGVTGRYFDQKEEARVEDQAYDPGARQRLRELSEELAGS